MNVCFADLHVHTALSPCADDAMTPPVIVGAALTEGLAMIAVCDHNSARNVAAVQEAAGEHLVVLAGIEITTVEECHVVGLFPDATAAEAAGAEVGAGLQAADDGYETFFGEQHLLDAAGLETGREQLALATASSLDVDAAVDLVHRHGGIAVAAHIDRRSFGVIGQLGLFPAEAGFDAVELSRHVPAGSEQEAGYAVHGLPILHSSDAHYVNDVGAARTAVTCEHPGFDELVLAVRGREGRRIGDA
ncbi:MAG TPA: PHP-associated domain-containing protein [Thermoleophilia bacterium]|nr:PHP-associated domain-containing protein [Thermoleophilia bacterium]